MRFRTVRRWVFRNSSLHRSLNENRFLERKTLTLSLRDDPAIAPKVYTFIRARIGVSVRLRPTFYKSAASSVRNNETKHQIMTNDTRNTSDCE